jgi:hypothetical protein
LAGLVAGEGSFSITRGRPTSEGTATQRFVFDLRMASRDRALLLELREVLGFGSVTDYAARNKRWLPMTALRVHSRKAHVAATIPFMDAYLLAPTQKRLQYDRWKSALLAYEQEHPRRIGRSTCSEEGCDRLVRGRGLCRAHYYRATGY